MSESTVNMLYNDFLEVSRDADEQVRIMCERKPGTIRAAKKNLESYYIQLNQIRRALNALGYHPTPAALQRI